VEVNGFLSGVGWECERCKLRLDWTSFGFTRPDAHASPSVTPSHPSPTGICQRPLVEYPCAKTGCPAYVATANTHCPSCELTEGTPADGSPGVTADDFAEVIDHAKLKGVRTFHLKTVMKGHPFELNLTFEPDREKKERNRE
jgi:hypothetical protein